LERAYVAPDGPDIRALLGVETGGMTHFEIRASETSVAVAHRTVGEIWYLINGRGEMWRKLKDEEDVVPVERGICTLVERTAQEPRHSVGLTKPVGYA
jgi:mannose-6-phosphate isomerase-like protein (cupin superfamily)